MESSLVLGELGLLWAAIWMIY